MRAQKGVEELAIPGTIIQFLPSNETVDDTAHSRMAVDAQEERFTIPAMLDNHVTKLRPPLHRGCLFSQNQRAWAEQMRNGELRIETRINKILAVARKTKMSLAPHKHFRTQISTPPCPDKAADVTK